MEKDKGVAEATREDRPVNMVAGGLEAHGNVLLLVG